MKKIDLSITKGAIFSETRLYRYALWRVWSPNKPLLLFIGINPSKANEIDDDNTINRNMFRASRNGYGGLLVANLFSIVSVDRGLLLKSSNPIGEFTDTYIKEMVRLSNTQLCAWGSFKGVKSRADNVYPLLSNPVCLGMNQDGEPVHPLFISYETQFKEYHRCPH